MKQMFYEGMTYVDLALFSMALFIAIFAAVLWKSLRMKSNDIAGLSAMPLNDLRETASAVKERV